jgi:copper chaperone CopZ
MLLKKSVLVVVGLLCCFALLGAGVYLVSDSPSYASAEFAVANMTCGSCASKIDAALAQISGVGEVQVDVARGTAIVAFADDRVSVYRLAKAISSAGFPAQVRQIRLASDGPPPVSKLQGNLPGSSGGGCGGCGSGGCGGS